MPDDLTPQDPLLAGDRAPAPRTLVDVLEATVAAHPDAPAIDDGERVLTYAALLAEVEDRAARLAAHGVRRGDRVGVRATSGRADLYLTILAVLRAGAAYVPVDADDPEERAALVFGEAAVAAVVGDDLAVTPGPGARAGGSQGDPAPAPGRPTVHDDAWIIFTSGSTGTPKGVAVTHRNAGAFVDAEAEVFVQDAPLGPGDRVLAGLSVAFDASCEEMWLAWRHGACLVPAPRSLVRSGLDLGPWVAERGITVVSTVPTLAGLLSDGDLAAVRLLIFGGEACPPELAARLQRPGREVWNTYGPTEATVVACCAPLDGTGPVRIGLPLPGWDLVVVDAQGEPVAEGATGELVIGGVGLARYLDPVRDAERYAPLPSMGWARAYRSGDVVVNDRAGLLFVGRADDQVKVGGRRIELGEVDSALLAAPGVAHAAAAVRTAASGTKLLVGYVVPVADPGPGDPDSGDPGAGAPDHDSLDHDAVLAHLREVLPAALVPLLAVVDEIPVRTSGKVDRDALPWPLPGAGGGGAEGAERADDAALGGADAAWLADRWADVLGVRPSASDDDFFDLGGGSLTAAQVVSAVRTRYPRATVADLYAHPGLDELATFLRATYGAPEAAPTGPVRVPRPTPRRAQAVQVALLVVLRLVAGLRWVTWVAVGAGVAHLLGHDLSRLVPDVAWWVVVVAWVVLLTPFGRLSVTALAARALLRGVTPGDHPRGGSVHLRIWFVEQLLEALGGFTLTAAPFVALYARALGARVGRGVDLHTLPPVTGMLTLKDGCAVEPEVDLQGHWLEGDVLHVGRIVVGRGATVGARSILLPGARIGKDSDVAAGSAVIGRVGAGEYWEGSPATRRRRVVRHPWPDERPARGHAWNVVFAVSGVLLALVPFVALVVGVLVVAPALTSAQSPAGAVGPTLARIPLATLAGFATLAVLTVVVVRLLGLGLHPGFHPVRSRVGWQAWATERVTDAARTQLFPLYSSLVTPVWLRLLGARVGRGVEASTVVGIPSMMDVADGAFLADDTMVASYELGGGWLRVEPARVGKRAFLGNSGIAAPGRSVPKNGLVAVLSAAPSRARRGTSWIGSPPVELRRAASEGDESLTYDPPARLLWARGGVEVLRLVAVMVSAALGALVVLAVAQAAHAGGWWVAVPVGGVALIVAGVVAALVTTLVKLALVGRFRAGEHPLWSAFVWRGELADTFTEVVAAPWFAAHVLGAPPLVWWLRATGARIGRGVWCETYWLPEDDLVTLGDGATAGRGTVLQTHLFHDRVMSLDEVRLDDGASVGPHSVVLPAAHLGAGSSCGPSSLVMRGEDVPAGTRWQGNPVTPWPLDVGTARAAPDPAPARPQT